jgi:AcrR family transcriptional regulator
MAIQRKRGIRPGSSIRGDRPGASAARGRRADAVANRARVLAAAAAAFDAHGLAVSLDDIARRAGVGPGTVHRHFPTKAALIDATVADRVASLAHDVAEHARAADPVVAFYACLAMLVTRGAASHALADRLAREAGDIAAAVAGPVRQLRGALARLLHRAQRAGGVRDDLAPAELDAILAGAHAIEVHPHGGPDLVARLCDALRPPAPAQPAVRRPRRASPG